MGDTVATLDYIGVSIHFLFLSLPSLPSLETYGYLHLHPNLHSTVSSLPSTRASEIGIVAITTSYIPFVPGTGVLFVTIGLINFGEGAKLGHLGLGMEKLHNARAITEIQWIIDSTKLVFPFQVFVVLLTRAI